MGFNSAFKGLIYSNTSIDSKMGFDGRAFAKKVVHGVSFIPGDRWSKKWILFHVVRFYKIRVGRCRKLNLNYFIL